MAEKTRNLCAEIPEELHSKVRQRQNESGKTLSQYMTWLITTFYEQEGAKNMEEMVTTAFQMPKKMHEELKRYLKRHGLTQVKFFLNCVQRALAEDSEAAANE